MCDVDAINSSNTQTMQTPKEAVANAATSRKRRAEDDIDPTDTALPSPSLSATEPTPKRPRLTDTRPKNTPPHLDITRSLTKTPLTPQTPYKKPTCKQQLATDPVNVSIYSLRKEGHAWDDIATSTNESCRLRENDELTSAACYSRFFRNGPLVAKERGKEWKREWYTKMKGPVVKASVESGDGDKKDGPAAAQDQEGKDEKMVEKAVLSAVEKVRAEFWKDVAKVVNEDLSESKEITEGEIKAVYDATGQGD